MHGRHGFKGGHAAAATTQTETLQSDGSIDVLLTTTHGSDTLTRTVSLAKAASGAYTITDTRNGHEISQTISADTDGGVDIDVSQTNAAGTLVTKHYELDLDTSGNLVIQDSYTGASGNTATHTRTMTLANFLGSADETLTVSEVTETLLQSTGVDVTLVGVAGLLA